jgi:hypothetical protein
VTSRSAIVLRTRNAVARHTTNLEIRPARKIFQNCLLEKCHRPAIQKDATDARRAAVRDGQPRRGAILPQRHCSARAARSKIGGVNAMQRIINHETAMHRPPKGVFTHTRLSALALRLCLALPPPREGIYAHPRRRVVLPAVAYRLPPNPAFADASSARGNFYAHLR